MYLFFIFTFLFLLKYCLFVSSKNSNFDKKATSKISSKNSNLKQFHSVSLLEEEKPAEAPKGKESQESKASGCGKEA